ncbi:MAG TPA: S1/P1 nuclease [Caldimonas sp.]|nr:S1/P1 nuclease [Caldimonas sp.]
MTHRNFFRGGAAHAGPRAANRWAPALALAFAPVAVSAWGPGGHQSVGAIADELLKGSAAAAQVKSILGPVSLQQASVWADCAKGVTSSDDVTFTYHANPAAFPECTPFDTPRWKPIFESFVARNWKQCGTAHDSEKCHHQYHYADISNRRDRYGAGEAGANDHDIVHAVLAAIEVLQGRPPSAPFDIAGKEEAPLILTHYVGDIHQPLHVVAVYLDRNGKTVDPDAIGRHAENDTTGGNSIVDGAQKLHHEWDEIPAKLLVGATAFDNLVARSRTIAGTSGAVSTWPTQWASETVHGGRAAFTGLRFASKSPAGSKPLWTVTGTHTNAYRTRADSLKTAQLAAAGARLAQLLKAIWPETP